MDLKSCADFEIFFFFNSVCRSTIRDKIIPHAVSWFTGEAIQDEDFEDMDNDDDDDDNDDDEEDEDDEEDDEEDDDEDEDEDQGKSRKKVCQFFFNSDWPVSMHIVLHLEVGIDNLFHL